MTPAGWAALLDGREINSFMPREESAQAEADGVVIVFGESDDLMELRGAIDNEVGCYNGGNVYLHRHGIPDDEVFECERCAARMKRMCAKIRAVWCPDDVLSWAYETDIPHHTFTINEDGAPYCRGIVFSVADLPEVDA